MREHKTTVFCVAFIAFKDDSRQLERVHFKTWHSTLKKAREGAMASFCDDAGWYEGFVIEEKQEGNYFFNDGQREWWISVPDGFKKIDEPKIYKNCTNVIG